MLRCNNGNVSPLQSASPFNQLVLSKFLRIKPKILGVFEISLGMMVFILTICIGLYYLLWLPLITFFTGAATVSAARTLNMCRVRTSQFLNCFLALTASLSITFHYIEAFGIRSIVMVVCDILSFIFSVIVASSLCECCRTKSRHVEVGLVVGTAVPNVTVNSFVLGLYAPPPNYESGLFVTPQNYSTAASLPHYSPAYSAPPSNYNPDHFAPPPDYSTLPSAPPPDYSTIISASSTDYITHPSTPPPNYRI
ncbi:uncharacterized protein [Paramisgurnus dabryanus]|uniref:uncharacterized protein n=1 Tax=Paramisgurnus dabryanus TaxID=90735 RepID=UPI0031F34BDC